MNSDAQNPTPTQPESPMITSRTCVILAGGKSVRFGRDKISARIGRRSLIERVVSRVEPLVGEIILVVAGDRSFPELEALPKIRKVSDIYPGNGSLGGIHAGLSASSSFYNLVVAADMPFLNPLLLRYMFQVSVGYDMTLPKMDAYFEPLHAVYSKNCVHPAEVLVRGGRKVVVDLLNHVRARYLTAEEIDRFDPARLSFFNINTEEDLKKARKLISRADGSPDPSGGPR